MDVDPFVLQVTSFVKPLPTVVERVLYLARQEPVDFKEIALVIETDPALSTLVISLANSPIYGSINREIDSLNRALMVLGQNRLIDSVMSYMARSIRQEDTQPWPSGDIKFWQHCIGVALCARMLAEKMQMVAAQQCFIAGLIHDVGKLALLNYDPAAYQQVLREVEGSQRPIELVELEAFGITHAALSGHISRRWKMPQHFMNAIAYHHDGADAIMGTLANVVRSANLIAKIAGFGDSGNPYNSLSNILLVPHTRTTADDVVDILVNLGGSVREFSKLILGSAAVDDDDPTEKVAPEGVVVSSRVADGLARTLLRYVAASLGYETETEGKDYGDDVQRILIMDFMSSHVGARDRVIDFTEWRSKQPQLLTHSFDIVSLRAWLAEKLEESVSASMQRA